MTHATHAFAAAALLLSAPVMAQETKSESTSSEAPPTKQEVRTLAEEIRRLKLEIGIPDVEYRSFAGLGPAASKVYYAPKGLAIGGYGEFTYRNQVSAGGTAESDLLRAVLYAGYRFNPTIVFNSEIEFEHAGREVSVEFAYLDFLFTDAVRLRVGNVLVPMGFVNEMHEPPFFHGVRRPDLDTVIIPTTWSENGVGLHGDVAGLRYKAFLVTGLDPIRGGEAEKAEDKTQAGTWLRAGRTGGAESSAESLAGVLNLVYAYGPATFGGSIYGGRAGQGHSTETGQKVHANVLLTELHAGFDWRGVHARGIVAQGNLGQADLVSAALGLSGRQVLASRVRGAYGEVAYDVLSTLGGEASLSPFVRWERINLHDQVPRGGDVDPALKYDLVTAGLTYKPIATVVLKADYQWKRTDATGDHVTNAVNVGAGFVF
jgi:hypothetical protein